MTHRTPWSALPPEVVQAIEAQLGASVVGTRSAADGFTPAIAVAADLADGRKVFLKACTEAIGEYTVEMQRREADVVRQLPDAVAAPELLFAGDFGDWNVVAFEHLDAQPVTDPVDFMRGVDDLYDALAGAQIDGLIHLYDHHDDLHTSWSKLAAEMAGLEALVDLEGQIEAFRSEREVLHCDIRDDNALVGADGRYFFVDWGNACLGPPVLDAIATIPSLHVRHGASVPELVGASRLIQERSQEDLAVMVADLAGYFAFSSTRPAPPNMPTVRAFQRAQAVPMLAWLNALVGDRISVPAMDDIERALQPGRSL